MVCTKRYRRADRFRQRCRVRFSKREAQLIQFVGDIKIAFLKTAIPSASPDVDLPQMFPGDDLKWGLELPDQHEARSGWSQRRYVVLVRAGQYLFLGRSRETRCWSYLHADTALRRSACDEPLRQIRKWCVPSGIVGPIASTTLLRPLLEAGAAQS